jgi:hypothetical protein
MKPVGEVEGALVESGPPVGCEDDPHPMNAKAQTTVRKENLEGMRRTICSGGYKWFIDWRRPLLTSSPRRLAVLLDHFEVSSDQVWDARFRWA